MKSKRHSDKEEGQLSDSSFEAGHQRQEQKRASDVARRDKKSKHRHRSRSSDSDRHSKRHRKHERRSPRRHHRADSRERRMEIKATSGNALITNMFNPASTNMLQGKESHDDEELPDFVDSEEELRKEELERNKLMELIKQKHNQVTTNNTVSIEVKNEVQVGHLIKPPSAQRDEIYKAIEEQREDFYKRLAVKSSKVDLFDNLSDSDSDENPMQEAIQKGFTVDEPNVDQEGYYQPKIGELINLNYKVTDVAGKGVFSCVVRAVKLDSTNQEVAIKIMRTKFEVMRVSGLKEREIARQLNQSDPYDRKHCIRLFESFEYNNHLCLVYESMGMNLRETLNKFGRNIGLSMDGVILYGRQLFLALSLLHRQKIIHADLKPDNIMVSVDTRKIKLCDFGSALSPEEVLQTQTEHLVSPFYRAPEIILGCMPFDTAVDIWSAGVTLFEVFTGKFMFPGRSNNHLLKLIMQTKGKVNHKLIKRGKFAEKHFNLATNQFIQEDEMSGGNEAMLGINFRTSVPMPQVPTKPILNQLKETFGSQNQDQRAMSLFADFLERCTVIDPQKRMTADEALLHPFLNILRERQQLQVRVGIESSEVLQKDI